MAAARRVVEVKFWTSPYVIETYSVEDKYFILYLMTNPATTQVGIYRLSKKVMSFETGYTEDVLTVLLERFEKQYKEIIYNSETQEITLLNSLTYSILKGGYPVSNLLTKELSSVIDSNLILQPYLNLQMFFQNSVRPFDNIVKGLFETELSKRNIPSFVNEEAVEEKALNTDSQATTNSLNKAIIYYENFYGRVSDSIKDQLEFWTDQFSEEQVVGALALSKHAKHPMKYAAKIIDNWTQEKQAKKG